MFLFILFFTWTCRIVTIIAFVCRAEENESRSGLRRLDEWKILSGESIKGISFSIFFCCEANPSIQGEMEFECFNVNQFLKCMFFHCPVFLIHVFPLFFYFGVNTCGKKPLTEHSFSGSGDRRMEPL